MINLLKILLLILIVISQSIGYSQLYNNTDMIVNNGAILSVVNASVVNDVSADFKNAGLVYIDKNITNNGQLDGAGVATGLFQIGENWFNNATFNADNSIVDLFGADQLIGGTAVTTFYDLRLNGIGTKLLAIDAKTTFLDLTVNELATDNYIMEVLSTNLNAISLSSGFVSSINDGYLKRHTDQTGDYLFPTGSSLSGSVLYRPITIAPTSSTPNVFGVRLAEKNASTDGYSLTTKEANVKKLNTNYYHHLYNEFYTNNADITFYFDPISDGEFENIAHWSNSLWTSYFNENLAVNSPFSEIKIENVTNFNSRAFILCTKQDEIFIQNAFTPNGDFANDNFVLNLTPEDFEEFTFVIFNRWGEKLVETNNPQFIWDGTFKGELIPMGVYPWKMMYRQKDDPEILTKMGHISLIK